MGVIAAAVAGAVVTLAFVIIDVAADITAVIAVIAVVVVVIAVAFVIAVAIDISNAGAVCVVYAGACCIFICMYLDARVKLYLLRASIFWPSSTTYIVACTGCQRSFRVRLRGRFLPVRLRPLCKRRYETLSWPPMPYRSAHHRLLPFVNTVRC